MTLVATSRSAWRGRPELDTQQRQNLAKYHYSITILDLSHQNTTQAQDVAVVECTEYHVHDDKGENTEFYDAL